MTEALENAFEAAFARYEQGEAANTLIPTFEELSEKFNRSDAVWTCLAWLYLLDAQAEKALKAARAAVRINPADPQARVNLSLAMLETDSTGVRDEIAVAKRLMSADAEVKANIKNNLDEGQKRRKDWLFITRVQSWVEE
ncbi:MAG: hypothetical protein AAF978_05975 [Cyanobacteria bacterium P01_E01_bin.48]